MWEITAIWLISATTCVAITLRVKHNFSWRRLRSLHRDEVGGAYTISYVMVIPIYLIAFCFVIETTFMLLAKIGTDYASFAAARTAIVWIPFSGEDRIEAAAQRAFVPFASGLRATPPGAIPETSQDKQEYLNEYQEYCGKIAAPADYMGFIGNKYDYAHSAISASTEIIKHKEKWDEDVRVTVVYEFPFSVPIVGRLMGRHKSEDLFVYDIQSSTTLQIEHPQNDAMKLGIDYVPH